VKTRVNIIAELVKVGYEDLADNLVEAIEFNSKEAMEQYMKLHPNADPKNHRVVEKKGFKSKHQVLTKHSGSMLKILDNTKIPEEKRLKLGNAIHKKLLNQMEKFHAAEYKRLMQPGMKEKFIEDHRKEFGSMDETSKSYYQTVNMHKELAEDFAKKENKRDNPDIADLKYDFEEVLDDYKAFKDHRTKVAKKGKDAGFYMLVT